MRTICLRVGAVLLTIDVAARGFHGIVDLLMHSLAIFHLNVDGEIASPACLNWARGCVLSVSGGRYSPIGIRLLIALHRRRQGTVAARENKWLGRRRRRSRSSAGHVDVRAVCVAHARHPHVLLRCVRVRTLVHGHHGVSLLSRRGVLKERRRSLENLVDVVVRRLAEFDSAHRSLSTESRHTRIVLNRVFLRSTDMNLLGGTVRRGNIALKNVLAFDLAWLGWREGSQGGEKDREGWEQSPKPRL